MKFVEKLNIKKDFFITALVYFFLALLFFYPIFQNKVLLYADNLLHIGPMLYFWKQEILQGRLPLWNPYIFAGMPFLADPSHSVFSPFNFFVLLIKDIFLALNLEAIFLTALASLGAFVVARRLNFKTLTCFWVGLFFGFSGSVMEAANDINSLVGIALMPWVMAVFLDEVLKKRKYFSVKLALILALQFLSGHTQYFYYTGILLFIGYFYSLVSRREKLLPNILLTVATLTLTLGLVAIQLLPAVEMWRFSQREESFEDFQGTSLSLMALPRLILPKIYGSIVEGNSWGPSSQLERGLADVYGFVEIGAIILSFWGMINYWQDRRIRFLSILTLVALLLSFGENLPFLTVFRGFLPGLSLFRSAYRILAVYSLSQAVLAGFTLEKVRLNRNNIQKYLQIISFMAFFLLLFLFLSLFKSDFFSIVFQKLYELIRQKSLLATTVYSPEKLNIISSLFIQSAIIFSLGLINFCLLLIYAVSKKRAIFLIVSGLIFLELFVSVRGNFIFVDRAKINLAKDKTVEFLEHKLEKQRFISTAETEAYTGPWVYFNHLTVRPPFSQEKITAQELIDWSFLSRELQMLPADTNQFYNLPSAGGYVAILPKQYREFFNSKRVNSLDFKDYSNPRLNDFSVKYFVSGFPVDGLREDNSGRFTKVFQSGKIVVYENKLVKPRLEFLSSQEERVQPEIIIEEPSRITIKLNNEDDGLLILRDFFYPDWSVSVDGQKKVIEPYQNIFRSVAINKGKHLIIFEYLPSSFAWGSKITVCTLFLLSLFSFIKQPKLFTNES